MTASWHQSRRWKWHQWVSLAAAVAALVMMSGQAQAGTAGLPKWHRTEVRSPAGATDGYLVAVSCPTKSQCVGGGYSRSSIGLTPMVASMSAGGWGHGRTVVLPATSTDPNGQGQITGISCPAKNACTAVGFNIGFNGSSFIKDGFTVSQSHGTWGHPHFVTLPAGSAAVTVAALNGVSCTSPGNCEAVGYFAVTGENLEPMAVREVHGSWRTANEVAVPANAATAPGVFANLNSVSCPKPGSCVSVGSYLNTTDRLEGLTAVESGGH
jgi:hypothetical protein